MKSGIHPSYRKVLFVDASSGDEWVSYSTMSGGDTRDHQGEALTVFRVDISSFSHPLWTGQAREVDTEGRMDRFRRRYNVKGGPSAQAVAPAAYAAAIPMKAEAATAAPKAAKAPAPKKKK